MQGRCLYCPFIGKLVKKSILEAGQKKVGGPKRGDKPFTTSFYGTEPIDDYSASYNHKKYCYIPAIDLLETANLIYREDIENLSPLYDTVGVRVIPISYSSIAVSCNSNKAMILNCLKEIFATVLNLVKTGNEVTLDLKIGTLNIMKDSKLMFRNYNPDVKLQKRKHSQQVMSQRSEVPTSVATPITNLQSTLSYRATSQDARARPMLNHVGIKRSGLSHQFNSSFDPREGEKLYYRHKKEPYTHLDSFINDSRQDMEKEIQSIRLKERQDILNQKKKERKGLSQTFNEATDEYDPKRAFNRTAHPTQTKVTRQRRNLNSTMSPASIRNVTREILNENEPSTVNDKLPSRFIVDYPNFL